VASIDQVSIAGFSDPITIAELRRTDCASVPTHTGIYLIERDSDGVPRFRVKSTGGWFNGLDPDCPPNLVKAKWVTGAHLVYVGKTAGESGLRRRLRLLIGFGCGKPVPHRVGRLLWHLEDSDESLVRWRACTPDEAKRAETAAIADFKRSHRGVRPFANMSQAEQTAMRMVRLSSDLTHGADQSCSKS